MRGWLNFSRVRRGTTSAAAHDVQAGSVMARHHDGGEDRSGRVVPCRRADGAALVLVDAGFEPDGETWDGHQHRWTDGVGQIDILLPEGIGARADRMGFRGGTTLEAPGAQNVLDRAQALDVRLGRSVATIQRPTIQGALLAKAFAFGVVHDQYRRRHLDDLATLSTLIRVSDRVGEGLSKRENSQLLIAYAAALKDPQALSHPGAEEGLARLRQAVKQ